MTTANLTVIGNVLFKRGNTTTASAYTGVPGEIIVDTTLQTLRVQDGVTVGGHTLASRSNIIALTANITAANAAITALQANAALQASLLDTLTSNAATQGGALNDLVANAASQASTLTTLIANAVTQAQQLANTNGNTTQLTNGAYQVTLQANGNVTVPGGTHFVTTNNSNIAIRATGVSGNAHVEWHDDPTGDRSTVRYSATGVEVYTTSAGVQRSWLFHPDGSTHFPQYTFPLGAGAPDSYLKSDGAGALNWYTDFGNLIPAANVTYSLGSSTRQWRDLWVSNNTIYIGGIPVQVNGGQLLVNNNSVADTVANLTNGASTFRLFANGQSRSPDTIFSANGVTIIDANGAIQGGIYNSGDADFFNIGASNGRGIKFYVNEESAGPQFFANGNIQVPANIISGTGQINFVANSSGDGYGFSTIELRPDANAFDDSYLIIDPTYPSHIHIRAGGTQDNSLTQLFLGGENSHFRVDSGLDPTVYVRSNNNDWTFDTDGNLTLGKTTPHGGINRGIVWDWGLGQAALGLGAGEGSNSYIRQTENGLEIHPNEPGGMGNGDLRIRTGNVSPGGTSYDWIFNGSGGLTFPTGGNVIFDSSSTSIIDGVTNINAVGTIGANVVQVLSDLTSFGASPAPRIYGFSSIATTGSAVNEGNISASGNLVAGQNAYITGNLMVYGNAIMSNIAYTPATSSDWSAPAPTTIGQAIDRLAAVVKTLNGGTGA